MISSQPYEIRGLVLVLERERCRFVREAYSIPDDQRYRNGINRKSLVSSSRGQAIRTSQSSVQSLTRFQLVIYQHQHRRYRRSSILSY